MRLHIYFHRDFDGIVSAALLATIFKKRGNFQQFIYKPVDFNIKNEWLSMKLEQPAAILDFFYHPDATYYFDHHESSISEQFFGKETVDDDYICLNTKFKSTPAILKYKFQSLFDFTAYQKILEWSDIIDNSEYPSPKDLYDNSEIYILLNKLISFYQDQNNDDEIIQVIPYILDSPGDYLTLKSEILEKIIQEERAVIQGLKKTIRLDNYISYVDQSNTNFAVQRFVSYYYHSDLEYQIVLYRKDSSFVVNFGRNPWKDFHSKNIGELAARYGGFGRKDVGGIVVQTKNEAELLVNSLIKDLSK